MWVIVALYYMFSLMFMAGYNYKDKHDRLFYVVMPLLCWLLFPVCLGMSLAKATETRRYR